MLELVTTRHNPMVDPSLHVWGWEIPVSLFLGGWVAGSMIVATLVADRQTRQEANIVRPNERDTSNWKWLGRWERLQR